MRVAAVIPAHNEEKNIAQAVLDLANQTYGVERIIVVDDHSTDRTLHVLHELYKNLPQLTILENAKPALRAGAINCGLERLSPDEFGLVVVADADSRFDRGLVEEAVRRFTADRRLGGICSTSGVLRPELTELPFLRRLESWFFWRIQRLNGADFDATRIASVGNVQILHGLCTIFRLQALLDIRGYTPGHMLEDYDLTIRLKQAGWRASYSPFMKAWTSVPLTFRSFFRQRLRWMRGGVDILLKNGLNRHTANDILNHTLFLILFLGVVSYIGFNIGAGGWRWRPCLEVLPLILALTGYTWSLCRLRYLDKLEPADVIVRVSLLPELFIAVLLSFCQLRAYYLALFGRPQIW